MDCGGFSWEKVLLCPSFATVPLEIAPFQEKYLFVHVWSGGVSQYADMNFLN